MRKDRNVSRKKYFKKELFHADRRDVVRWFDENIAAVGDGRNLVPSKLLGELHVHVSVGAAHDIECDARPA